MHFIEQIDGIDIIDLNRYFAGGKGTIEDARVTGGDVDDVS